MLKISLLDLSEVLLLEPQRSDGYSQVGSLSEVGGHWQSIIKETQW